MYKKLLLKTLTIATVIIAFNACKQTQQHVSKIEGKYIKINDNLAVNDDIEAYIKPYRERLNKDLDSVLCYAVDTYSDSDGEFNTAIGNFLADMIVVQANPILQQRIGENIDIVIINHGGIRADINKGEMTARTAYEVMPFDNSIVVAAMKGKQIHEAIKYLCRAKRAHPISGLKLTIDKDFKPTKVLIRDKPIEDDKTYYVATNDYLYNGGDGMVFFQKNDSLYTLDYKIRNAFIDYMKKVDTINPVKDDRFIQTK